MCAVHARTCALSCAAYTTDFWKYWRGVPWLRPSVGAHWVGDVMSSWGPFEMIDMCEAAGIEPIITTTSQDQAPRHTGPYDCCSTDEYGNMPAPPPAPAPAPTPDPTPFAFSATVV